MSDVDAELRAALEAIGSAPGDEERRRVLADLLLERGDERGEFIALQLLHAENQASAALLGRMRELRKRHRTTWAGEVARYCTEVSFARGFPVRGRLLSHLTAAQLEAATRLPSFVTLERVEGTRAQRLALHASPRMAVLSEVEVEDDAFLAALAARAVPRRLKRLECRSPLTPKRYELIASHPVFERVEELHAVVEGWNLAGLRRLAEHPALRVLRVRSPRFELRDLKAAWASSRLARLELNVRLAYAIEAQLVFEREGGGTLVSAFNLSRSASAGLRRLAPSDTTRALLFHARSADEAFTREQLIAAWAPIPLSLP